MDTKQPSLLSIAARHAEWDREFADLLSGLSRAPDELLAARTATPHAAHSETPTDSTALPAKHHHPQHDNTVGSTEAPPATRARLETARAVAPKPKSNSETATPREETTKSPLPLKARYELSLLKPYEVQLTMMRAIRAVLEGLSPSLTTSSSSSSSSNSVSGWSRRPVAVLACEVPTGCGKTVSLLSSVLQFAESLRRCTLHEAQERLDRGAFWTPRRRRAGTPSTAFCAPPSAPLSADSLASLAARELKTSGEASETPPPASTAGTAPRQKPRRQQNNDDNEEEGVDGDDDGWSTSPAFLKAFRVVANKRLRAELDPSGSSELRRRFVSPPCTIFFAARTHAQLKQAIQEMGKLEGASQHVRMNILGSREHYCVNPTVVRAKGNHTLPVEGNNLGEVCDKLVSQGQCPCVEKYGELACKAISDEPLARRTGRLWDMEDLVAEGSVQQACPYYAARDLVFFADINFCAYNYLLDPIIRHECRMEASVRNNAIVILDEAHNVPAVCQDALSLEVPIAVMALLQRELEPLAVRSDTNSNNANHTASSATARPPSDGDTSATFLTYPRDFKLTHYTLTELFALLLAVVRCLDGFFRALATAAAAAQQRDKSGSSAGQTAHTNARPAATDDETPQFVTAEALVAQLRTQMQRVAAQCVVDTSDAPTTNRGPGAARRQQGVTASWSAAQHASTMFKQIYGIVMSLGVTFNPFNFSIFALAHLKRWLVVLRFLFERPAAFALSAVIAPSSSSSSAARATTAGLVSVDHDDHGGSERRDPPFLCAVRCLDGGLAFHHLLRSTYRVILASGTLSPFDQLARDLALTPDMWHFIEGQHVVGASQYQLRTLTHLPGPAPPSPLQCTHVSLTTHSFVARLAATIVELAETVPRGGVLVFVPSYGVLQALFAQTQRRLASRGGSASGAATHALASALFCEPRKAVELTGVLDTFKWTAQRRPALLFSVYRGKISEGIDFTDDMARLVLCVGVPLQPLKSWRVVAQRAYSGPEWYTNDAVRAVNQALGRCLRHAGDFGVVMLLECRYERAEYQRRLSRWCRDALVVDAEVGAARQALTTFYAHWCGDVAANPAIIGTRDDTVVTKTRGEELTDATTAARRTVVPVLSQLPGNTCARLPAALRLKPSRQPAVSAATAVTAATSQPQTPLSVLKQHHWSSTAIKLLYETCADTTDVSGAQFRQQLEALDDEYGGSQDVDVDGDADSNIHA